MKKIIGIILTLIMLMSVTLVVAGNPTDMKTNHKKVIIGFVDKPNQADENMIRGLGGKTKYTYHIINAKAVELPEQAIDRIKENPRVKYVEEDGEVHAHDLELENSWGVERIGADIVHNSGNTGAGVRVAIIDTGIDYNHPDLDGNYKGGIDYVNDDNDPLDDAGHGTHCAGIVAAEDNDIGVVGVAPEAHLYGIKVLDSSGSGSLSDVIAGIQWLITNDMQIISMSLGGGDYLYLEEACDAAYNAGIVIVASAGNSGNPPGRGDNVGFPAKYSSVIAVAATDINDNRATWSSTGPAVELAAPGVSIYSTIPEGYGTKSGTSMAAPHVAGTAALVIEGYPGWENFQVREQLQITDDDLGESGLDNLYGWGLVDADEAALPTDTTPPANVIGLTITTVNCIQLDLLWDANTETDLHHYNVYRSTTSGESYDLIASPTTNLYLDAGLTVSTPYYYVVSAVDTSENEGEIPDEASGTTNADDLGPVTSNVFADPNPTNSATSVTLTADIDDSTTGNSNIFAAEYFVDTAGADGFGTSMSASDGDFNSPTEAVTIDVSGWTVGQYTLFVHGQDAALNWGETVSVVLDVTEEPTNIMYVESIVFSSKVAGPNKFLYTTVKVVDGSNPLEGVGVEMTLDLDKENDGTIDGSWNFAGDTGTDGTVKFTLSKAPSGYYSATVTNLILDETSASCELLNDGTVQ